MNGTKSLLLSFILLSMVISLALPPSTWAAGTQNTFEWPSFRNAGYHVGYTPEQLHQSPSLIWRYSPGGTPATKTAVYIGSSPAVVGGTLYAGSGDGYLYALNAADGRLAWKFKTNDTILSSPTVANGLVYIGSDDFKMYAVDSSTGSLVWSFATGGPIRSSATVAGDMVYFGSDDANLYSLNSLTGALIWSFKASDRILSTPTLAEGRVYFGSDDGYFYALNAQDGQLSWRYWVGNRIWSTPAYSNGSLYFGAYTYAVYALNATTGSLKWTYSTNQYVRASAAVAYGKVFIESVDTSVYALDANSGALVWRHQTDEAFTASSPLVAGDTLFTVTSQGTLYALNVSDGSTIWTYRNGDMTHSSPAVAEGQLFGTSRNNTIYAFGTGSPRQNTLGVQDWSGITTHNLATTEGGSPVDFNLQVAKWSDQIYFRVQFDLPGASNPGLVFFAIELAKASSETPMSQGNEMLIVSQKGPGGSPAPTYSYYLASTETEPEAIIPTEVTVNLLNITNGHYEFIFSRPMQTNNTDKEYQFEIGKTVPVAFAISQWGGGSTHSYTLFAWQLEITDSQPTLTTIAATPPASAGSSQFYNLVAAYGQYLQYIALGAVSLHFLRRKAWNNVEHGERVSLERHVRSARMAHWIRVPTLVAFIITGWSVFAGQPIFGASTVLIHVSMGFIILFAELPLHTYALLKKGEYKRILLISRDDVKATLAMTLNFLGFSAAYPEHAVYDSSSSDYYMGRKYCALQKFLFWGYLLALGGLGLTGFAMWYHPSFQWLFDLLGGTLAVKGIHLLLFYTFTSLFIGHIYLSLIPSNWQRLKAIVEDKCDIPIYATRTAYPGPQSASVRRKPEA